MGAVQSEPEHLSQKELIVEYGILSPADKLRLRKIATLLANTCNVEWNDLLQEALCRALTGERNCPKGLSMVVFLIYTMKSIASSWRKSPDYGVLSKALSLHADNNAEEEGEHLAIDPPDSRTPEAGIEAGEILERIERLFVADESTRLVLIGQAEGMSPAEIQEMTDLDKTGYASALKRIRRAVEKLRKEEGQS